MSTYIKKPMLASPLDSEKYPIQFPVIVSPKLDGIRCLIVGGEALSRNFKPIPNEHVRDYLQTVCPDGFDGELMVPEGNFGNVASAFMSFSGEPNFEYWVFDYVKDSLTKPYSERLKDLEEASSGIRRVKMVPTQVINNEAELLEAEEKAIAEGYEGLMLRSPHGPYREGRSTSREGYLLKLKRFDDSEAEIIGFEEKMTNLNEAEKDAFGRTKRSTAKDGMVPAGTLGAYKLRDIYTGVEFSAGSGLDDETRLKEWGQRDFILGDRIKYKFQGKTKDKPRFPIIQGKRYKADMDPE